MPPQVEKIALQEVEGLSKMSPSTTEYSIGLTYIDYLAALPWNKKTEDSIDLTIAKTKLDKDCMPLKRGSSNISRSSPLS